MATPRYHLVRMPPNFLVLRIFQLVFSIFVLGLAAYGVTYDPIIGVELTIFTAICSIIILIYIIVATYSAPKAYQYWAILGLEIFMLVFWVISFPLLAAGVSYQASILNMDYGYTDTGDYYEYSSGSDNVIIICLLVAAGLGGLMFVFSIISTVIFSVMLHRHRRGGGHCTIATATGPPNPNYNDASQKIQAEKNQTQVQETAYPVQSTHPDAYSSVPPQVQQMPVTGHPQPPQAYQTSMHV